MDPFRRALVVGALGAAAGAPAAATGGDRAAAGDGEALTLALIEGLSGPFGNAGEAVWRNLLWAVERVNARGGVRLPGGARPLALQRLDSKGQPEEAIALLRGALDRGVGFVLQGNSSAVAGALVDALDKHNAREPARRALLLNYSAVDPALTNERCSRWHFRFDAHADMRLDALLGVLRDDTAVRRVYLIGQDYAFGQHVARQARARLAALRPDIAVVGDELHPLGRVRDFLPYAAKIVASSADAVLTANWGNDLTLLVRALREAGSPARLVTFYGNALGAPAAIGDDGVGRVLAVAEWHPNLGDAGSQALHAAFRRRFPAPDEDLLYLRMQILVEMLADAIERAGSPEAAAVAAALEGARFDGRRLGVPAHEAWMRAADHQLQQPLVVMVMDRVATPGRPGGVRHGVEGTPYGFRTLQRLAPAALEQPHRCRLAAS